MTNLETIRDLRIRNASETENKIYNHLTPQMKQSYFSEMLIKIEKDMCKPITVVKFFGKFGYVGEWNNFERK